MFAFPLLTSSARSAAAAAVITLLAVLSASSSANATFTPVFDAAVANTTPEATSDVSFQLELPKGDANFAAAVLFTPGDWGIVEGRDFPVGAIVGSVESDVTLGFIGAACNTELPVEMDLVNASIDINDTVSFNDTNKTDHDNTPDYAKDVSPRNGLYDAFDRYPEFNNRIFDTANLQPVRRAAGISIVGGTPLLLQFLTFPPGTLIYDSVPNGIALGYPTVVTLQSMGDAETEFEPGPITDFCTPLTATPKFFGVSKDNSRTFPVIEGGTPLLVNPQDGRYTFALASNGQRDADGDTYENSLDTCPYDMNIGSPRVTADGDLDQDGLDAACDPNDDPLEGGTNSDEDSDGYLNRQDNCPLVMNGQGQTNQLDADHDGIGDVCDRNPNVGDGELLTRWSTKEIAIGSGTGPGGTPECPEPGCWSPPAIPAEPDANGNVDCDGDIDAVDALKELRYVVQLPVSQTQPCPGIGTNMASFWGDVDCDGGVTSVDALKILRFVAGLPVQQGEPCPDMGKPGDWRRTTTLQNVLVTRHLHTLSH